MKSLNLTHEETIAIETAIEARLETLLSAYEIVPSEYKEVSNGIISVHRRVLEKAKDLNNKFKRELEDY